MDSPIIQSLRDELAALHKAGVIGQEARHGQPGGVLARHAQRQRLDPAQDQVSRLRRYDVAPQPLRPGPPRCGRTSA